MSAWVRTAAFQCMISHGDVDVMGIGENLGTTISRKCLSNIFASSSTIITSISSDVAFDIEGFGIVVVVPVECSCHC
jgi:hypothetical protein